MKDLTNQRFGRLIAIQPYGKTPNGNITWLCRCDCGNEHIAASGKLLQGKVKSCGCYAKVAKGRNLVKHGLTVGGKPRIFTVWNDMKARCLNPNNISFKHYGGRGITVCEEWLTFSNFYEWALANGYNDNLQIDRINNDGNYEPDNCRFVTRKQNIWNQPNTKIIACNGISLPLSEWARTLHCAKETIYKAIDKGEIDHFLKMRMTNSQFDFEQAKRISTEGLI